MFYHDDSLKFPRLTQCNLPSGRCYVAEDGENKGLALPSITRVLGKKPKPQLEAWKKKQGPEKAALISQRATVQGSSIHKLMECLLNNDELPRFSPNVGNLWQYLKPWLIDNIAIVYAQEQPVASFMLGVAGQLDLLAGMRNPETIAIVDAKTASRKRKEEYNLDYYVQATFYALAVYETTGQVVKRAIFPIVSPDGLQVFEVAPAQHYQELRHRIDDFYADYEQEPVAKAETA